MLLTRVTSRPITAAINMCVPLNSLYRRSCPDAWLPIDKIDGPTRDEEDAEGTPPEPADHFYRQLDVNPSTWPALAASPYAEVVLTHWLRTIHAAPIVNISQLVNTRMFKVRDDGYREPAAFVMA
eukprot:6944626-Prymnesium_polylepis.1